MEHRNEIINEPTSKEIFLQNNLVEYENPHIYSLEAEFAKTKKNRDLKPYLIFFGFILLLILSTGATVKYLDTKSKQINIEISDFEDLRLKETLSAAKEKEHELNRKTKELHNKTEELNNKSEELQSKTSELDQLNSSFDTKVQQIKQEVQQEADLKNADKKALKRLEQKEKKQIEDLKKEYDKQLAKKDAENALLREQGKKLELCQNGLNLFLKENKATGCVMDPRQRKNILLYFPKNPKLSAETIVEVYRTPYEYIGKLKLVPIDTGLRAELVEVSSKQSIKPLDWFQLP
jgi:myosin heavy subunit